MSKDTHITIQGDTWDSIALSLYGKETYMHALIDNNPQYRDVVVFSANCILTIPTVPTNERLSFPPWRGGRP